MEIFHTIGRRKNSVARLYLAPGEGKITINQRDYNDYFPQELLKYKILQPFSLTESIDKFDLRVRVCGGGVNGQAEAIRLAISRALCNLDTNHRALLKPEGFLTRDPRKVERKKFGRKKARKRFQFSKR
ncbi:30S ribosomal protein S9 [Bacteroidetes bacterium endosymbiont of Geopemphigus sp.]|uniref:30S ribosomal protein S9 n=1 Tax=Bacteroidetes bacterium endosymbiont of Geopemphigus sp. TaxID=2047937 RepID=UPI000CD1F052|nr:30S ribosomal protein S9 [Bacteroidetes bacterium endosymbiont of Geopemphigus sp.]